MPRLDISTIESLLSRVQKPARYIGRELNVIIKESAAMRMALSYPDLYEVGMSNNGMRILCDIVNAIPEAACERVFAVEKDLEEALRQSCVPLYTLETYTPLRELDIVGFNLSHELLYTNVLQILDLGGVPLRRRDRRGSDPIIIAGGEAASNPFPMSDFIDLFFLGDGEEGMREIAEAFLDAKKRGVDRNATIARIGEIEGILDPSKYVMSHDDQGGVESGPVVRKRAYRSKGPADPVRPPVPNIRIAQERVVLDVTRGCSNFCNFCHAGFYDLPYRSYSFSDAAGKILEMVGNTGYNEVTLSSLSISDYPGLAGLINAVLPALTEKGITLSFPSLRVDTATLPLIERISELRRASLTFAVEAASERLRDRANKKVVIGDLMEIVRRVHGLGWKVIKLYFMIGLPGCEEQDEAADIIGLLNDIHRAGGRGLEINVTVSPFVPKPHTPFQRERQMGRDYFDSAVRRIKRGLPRSVKIKNHDVEASVIEGVLARGDSGLGEVIERCYRDGCRFDSWDEHFRYEIWKRNLDETFPLWERALEGPGGGDLPWRFVETGFEALVKKRSDMSAACLPSRARSPHIREEIDGARLEEAKRSFMGKFTVVGRVRFRIAKRGLMRFIPHNDFMEIIKRALRMADAPVAMTQGFNKRERMSAGFPLPLGIESEAELVDVELFGRPADDIRARLNGRLPDGISVTDARAIDQWVSIMASTCVIEYRIGALPAALSSAICDGLVSGIDFVKQSKKHEKKIPFSSAVHSYEVHEGEGVILRLFTGTEDSIRVDEAVRMLAGEEDAQLQGIRIVKMAQYQKTAEGLALIE